MVVCSYGKSVSVVRLLFDRKPNDRGRKLMNIHAMMLCRYLISIYTKLIAFRRLDYQRVLPSDNMRYSKRHV